jgi:hypothetical protein
MANDHQSPGVPSTVAAGRLMQGVRIVFLVADHLGLSIRESASAGHMSLASIRDVAFWMLKATCTIEQQALAFFVTKNATKDGSERHFRTVSRVERLIYITDRSTFLDCFAFTLQVALSAITDPDLRRFFFAFDMRI